MAVIHTTRAVVLARGLGTRMREADPAVTLTPDQQRSADAGLKPMMPINGRPFIDYVLGAAADAGVTDVALVVAPDHEIIRRHFDAHAPARLRVAFVVQDAPLGTANAVLAAERWAAGEPFLVMNADNLYPVPALRDLAALDEPGLLAFEAGDLVRTSNIPADRVKAFAIVEADEQGYLTRVIEKPGELPPDDQGLPPDDEVLPPEGGSYGISEKDPAKDDPAKGDPAKDDPAKDDGAKTDPTKTDLTRPDPVASAFRRKHHARALLISMNCWRFDARIFDACRDVPRSRRGEFELPQAVMLALGRGMRLRALSARGPVLDLSRRADMADLARRLGTVPPRP